MNMFCLFFSLVVFIQSVSTDFKCAPTSTSIQQRLDQVYIPGISIVVVNRNQTLYQKAIGYQSPPISVSDKRQPMNVSSSIFVLASISKTFIAVAAMQMVELNRLNLDEDIHKYLPTGMIIRHPQYSNVTITTRHLLTHRAAIGQNMDEEVKFYLPEDDFTKTDLGQVIENFLSKNASWLPYAPGGNTTFYSNIGACLAAFIVQRLANMSFEDYVRQKILNPLGINKNQAGYRLSNFPDRKQLVGHYIYNASYLQQYQTLLPQLNISQVDKSSNWLYVPFYGISRYPAGYLRMSTLSLSLFLQSFLNNFTHLLHNSSSIEEILRILPQESFKNLSSSQFGLQWYRKNINGRDFIGHEGSVPGITTIMMSNEQRTLGVIILSNGDVVRNDNQAKEVQQTINNMTKELFDCFENSANYFSYFLFLYSISFLFTMMAMFQ